MDVRPEDRFYLDNAFINNYIGEQPAWGPVGLITYKRTYARKVWFKEQDGTYTPAMSPRLHKLATENKLGDYNASEEFWLTCTRVVEGVYTIQKWHCHKNHLPWDDAKAQKSAQEMFQRMWDFKFIPPGRGLWMMGTEYVEKYGGAALNNCGFVSTEFIDQNFAEPFVFLMDMSMLGVGIGGDTEGAGKVVIQAPRQGTDTFVVADTREGWVDLVARTLNAYVGLDTLPAAVDYSQVRPEGTPIRGFGGTASGPGPLQKAYALIQGILNPLAGKAITSEAIVALFDVIGVCVVSGNVRRSAIIMLGKKDDQKFIDIKDPKHLIRLGALKAELEQKLSECGYDADGAQVPSILGDNREQLELSLAEITQDIQNHPLRQYLWASNNSIYAEVGQDYTQAAKLTASNGEPGYFWLETTRKFGRMADPANFADMQVKGTNPCSEQSLEDRELCCLVETFPSRHATYEDYQRTLKFAYLYAKSVTLVPTHNAKTNAVLLRNRRIGTSQSGIVQSMQRHGRRTHFQWCDQGYKYLDILDTVYANWLCVPKSRKKTSVKPSGTVSLLPGVTPGIHFEHAEYYYRTIRIAKSSALIEPLCNANYRIEDDVYDSSSYVVYFPVHAEHFDRAKADVSMWEQLENAAQMQYYWADNQVSVTVTFKPEEAKDIGKALELYETRLKSVSFLPLEEHAYAQAPYITITREEFERASAQLLPIKFDTAVNDTVSAGCDSDSCALPFAKK